MEVNIFRSYNTSERQAALRHVGVILTAMAVDMVLWLLLDRKCLAALHGRALSREVLSVLLQTAVEAVLIMELSLLASRLIIKALWNAKRTFGALVLHCLLLLLVVLAISAVVAIIFVRINPDKRMYFDEVILCDAMTTYFLTSVFYISFLINKFRDEHEAAVRSEMEALRDRNLAMNAEIGRLKLQTDNHFVFNSLSTLQAMIATDPKAAGRFAHSMSRMYRYIVSQGDKPLVPLSEDLEFMLDYKANQETRLNGVQILIDVSPEAAVMIPPLTLQGLVENAIKHNAHGKDAPLTVEIALRGDRIEVTNNVRPLYGEPFSPGTGLRTIEERYRMLSEGEVEVRISEDRFTVSLPAIKIK